MLPPDFSNQPTNYSGSNLVLKLYISTYYEAIGHRLSNLPHIWLKNKEYDFIKQGHSIVHKFSIHLKHHCSKIILQKKRIQRIYKGKAKDVGWS